MTYPLIKDERFTDIAQLTSEPHAKILSLKEALQFFASPDSGKRLRLTGDQQALTDGANLYKIFDNIPILYPLCISEAFLNDGLEMKYHDDSFLQYFLLSQIKQRGEINSPSNNINYKKHLFRMKEFVKHCRGLVLDVGCDDVEVSASLFDKDCSYIGLDPFSRSKLKSRVVGVGEYLPFCDETIDNVIFNTSLDHILDYHQALEEAKRVLKPGGQIYVSTLIWESRASLLNDSVHFHHFREFEIFGGLGSMKINQIVRYEYKGDKHRYGLYLSAIKE